jgi:hypothetical protein
MADLHQKERTMTLLRWLGVWLIAVLLVGGLGAEPPADPEIAKLIKQLEAPRFDDREAAAKRLEEIGPAALPALREAAQSRNPAVAQRAALLVQLIEQRGDAKDTLLPTQVEIDCQEKPLGEVLTELGTQVKLTFKIDDEMLRNKKVTFKTAGKMPFWRAVEQLSKEAGFHLSGSDGDAMLTVTAGAAPAGESCHLGAVWLRLRPLAPKGGNNVTDERKYILEVYSEPRIQWRSGLELRLVGAKDNKGQEVTLIAAVPNDRVEEPNKSNTPPAGVRHELLVRLRVAEEAGDILSHLKGQLVARVDGKPTGLTIDDVLKARGQTVKNQAGDQLRLLECRVNPQGGVTLRLELSGSEQVANNPFGMQMQMQMRMQIQVNGAMQLNPAFQIQGLPGVTNEDLALFDVEGRPYIIQGRSEGVEVAGGTVRRTLTLFLQPPTPQSKPRKLTMQSNRPAPLVIEFDFKNLPM